MVLCCIADSLPHQTRILRLVEKLEPDASTIVFGSAREAVAQLSRMPRPDVVLINGLLPVLTAPELVRRLVAMPQIRGCRMAVLDPLEHEVSELQSLGVETLTRPLELPDLKALFQRLEAASA